MKYFVWTIILLFSTSCSNKRSSTNKIDAIDYSKISYSLSTKKKALFKNDTTESTYNVYLVKNTKDSMYGFNFKIEHKDIIIYNLENTTYCFYLKKKLFEKFSKFKNNTQQLLLPHNQLTNKDLHDTLSVTRTENGNELIIKKKYKDKNEFKNIYNIYHFSKSNNQYSKIIKNIDYQFTSQHHEYHYTNYNYSKSIDLNKEILELQKEYTLLDKKITTKTVDSIKHYRNFSGKLLNDGKLVNLDDFKEKIIILDYWYMSCAPCIKSIPSINYIYNKYKEEDVAVLGVNHYDNKQGKRKDLLSFKNFNNIEYPIILTNENTYNISAYPTIIVINKEKKIISTLSGYSENNKIILDSLINAELRISI